MCFAPRYRNGPIAAPDSIAKRRRRASKRYAPWRAPAATPMRITSKQLLGLHLVSLPRDLLSNAVGGALYHLSSSPARRPPGSGSGSSSALLVDGGKDLLCVVKRRIRCGHAP